MTYALDFDALLAGLPLVEEDHVFAPVGPQLDPAVAALMRERASLLDPQDDEEPGGERALSESYTDRRDELDAQIAQALEQSHPDAPVVRLRGLSDRELKDCVAQVDDLVGDDGKPWDLVAKNTEANVRLVALAMVRPTMTAGQARKLHETLNAGEWARLVDHVNRLTQADAAAVTLPNS